jgi:hypothetical protein
MPTTGSGTTASTKTGCITLRHAGRLHHIGIGRTHDTLLAQDLHIRVVNGTTGELLRDLTLDPHTRLQPRSPKTHK